MPVGQTSSERIDRTCDHESHEYDGTYDVEARCSNCGWTGEMRVTMGHEAWRAAMQAKCPRCKCEQIKAGDWLRGEAPEGRYD